jgi:ATP-grasp in the biosynthetic pathway with Ter operon
MGAICSARRPYLAPARGTSVLRESIPLAPDITAGAGQLVMDLGVDGYCEVEFRRDAAGKPALMEINPRLSASVESRRAVGRALPHDDLRLGERRRPADVRRPGVRMRWLGGDLMGLRSVITHPGARRSGDSSPTSPGRPATTTSPATTCGRR